MDRNNETLKVKDVFSYKIKKISKRGNQFYVPVKLDYIINEFLKLERPYRIHFEEIDANQLDIDTFIEENEDQSD